MWCQDSTVLGLDLRETEVRTQNFVQKTQLIQKCLEYNYSSRLHFYFDHEQQ